jgi:hypothetical protein
MRQERDRRLVRAVTGVLSLLIFAGVILLVFTHQQENAVAHLLREAASSASYSVDRAVREQIGLMNGMAASLSFDHRDLDMVRLEAQRIWDLHPEWRTIIVTDERQPLLNLRFPPGEPMSPLRDPESLAQVWATGKSFVGNLVHGYVVFRVPVIRNGRVIYTIAVPTDPQFFRGVLGKHSIDQPWTAVLIGGDKVVIAATTGSPVPEGKPLSRALPQSVEGFAAADDDYLAWAPIGESGWQILIIAPAAAVGQPFAQTRAAVYAEVFFSAVLTTILVLALSSALAARRQATRLRLVIAKQEKTEKELSLSMERLRLAHKAANSGTLEWNLKTNKLISTT